MSYLGRRERFQLLFFPQGLEMIQPGKSFLKFSQVESFLSPDKQVTPEEGWRIQRPKRCRKKKQ